MQRQGVIAEIFRPRVAMAGKEVDLIGRPALAARETLVRLPQMARKCGTEVVGIFRHAGIGPASVEVNQGIVLQELVCLVDARQSAVEERFDRQAWRRQKPKGVRRIRPDIALQNRGERQKARCNAREIALEFVWRLALQQRQQLDWNARVERGANRYQARRS